MLIMKLSTRINQFQLDQNAQKYTESTPTSEKSTFFDRTLVYYFSYFHLNDCMRIDKELRDEHFDAKINVI